LKILLCFAVSLLLKLRLFSIFLLINLLFFFNGPNKKSVNSSFFFPYKPLKFPSFSLSISVSQSFTNCFWVNEVSLAAQRSLLKNSGISALLFPKKSIKSSSNKKNFDLLQQTNRTNLQSIESLDSLKKKNTGFSIKFHF